MEQLRFTPFLFGSRLENVKTFVEELKQLLRWQNLEQTSENVWSDEDRQTNSIKQELHKEWIKVIDELGLKERKTGPMSGSFYMRLYETRLPLNSWYQRYKFFLFPSSLMRSQNKLVCFSFSLDQ